MFAINQKVMHYKYGISTIESIEYNEDLLGEAYKVVSEDGTVDYVLLNTKEKKLRNLVTKEEIANIKSRMEKICDRMIKNKKEREAYYNNLSLFGNFEDLVIIAKRYYYFLQLYHPSYLTLKEREIFEFTKKKLFSEVAYVMEIPYDSAEEYLFMKKKKDSYLF